ncbi:MAG: DNA-processing protein DprA [Candidatus Krumholzibacteriota bacterium]|nr:DNA-processing protein DprA [Candidatus Krumholzibacteriota bacterium]
MGCTGLSRAWLRILSSDGVGAGSWRRLSRRLSPERIAAMLETVQGREWLCRILGRPPGPPDLELAAAWERRIDGDRCRAVSLGEPGYPPLLAETSDPPPLLFVSGAIETAARPVVCIVGSRAASRRGRVVARELAAALSRLGVAVVSGLARGIDTAAHLGALEEEGGTVAVLGCGIDVAYPRENADLAVEIARRGCLVSEFPFGTPPLRHHFPRRNRILAGLALGTVVVEAGEGSGAMVTAALAAEEGREVLAVPGPVDHPGSRGPHRLLRDGAALVESLADVLDAIPALGAAARAEDGGEAETGGGVEASGDGEIETGGGVEASGGGEIETGGDETASRDGLLPGGEAQRLVAALDLEPKHIDELAEICDIPAVVILPLLLELEMRGVVERCGVGLYAIAPGRKRRGDAP